MTYNSNISGIIAQFQVGNTSSVKKQTGATDTATSKSEGTTFKGEKGSDILAAMGMQGAQNLQLSQKQPPKELVFDPQALTAQIEGAALDSSTMEGLKALSQPGALQMFGGFSDKISDKPVEEQLAMQNALLSEFKSEFTPNNPIDSKPKFIFKG